MVARSYTSAGPLEPFTVDGVEFQPSVSALDLMDIVAASGAADLDGASSVGLKATMDLFRQILGDQYDAFAAHARARGTRLEMISQIFIDIIADAMGSPTQPPPEEPGPVGGSADGRASTGPTSLGGSSGNYLDLGLLGMLARHRALSLDPERAEELRAAVARVEAELAGSPPG